LRNIVERAKNVQPGEIDLLVQEIRAIEHAVPAPWLQHGELHTALGAAYGELQRFEPAIAHYQKALASEDGQSTLHAVEQLCNLEVRFAQTLSRIEAIDRLNQAIGRLNALCAVSSTAERHSLRASATKRQFMLLEDTSTYKESLDRMVNDYLTAYTLSSQAHPKDFDPYPLVNYVAVRVVLDPLQETPKPIDIEQLLRQAEQAAQARDQHTPEFWNAVIAPDCEVVRALYNRNLSTRKEEILQAYRQTLARSGSPREWDSVVEQFTFLLRAVRLWESKDPSSEAALESIQKALRAM
jgi:tetratricopeptide (TPR) repeat protein